MTLSLPVFLVMSFLSGLFEIGSILWMLAHEQTPWAPFLAAFAYQLGAAATSTKIGRLGRAALAVFTLLSAALVLWRADLTCVAFGTFVVSALINIARMDLGKSEISTTAKRISRVSGFLVAPAFLFKWFVPVAFAVAAIIGVASILISTRSASPSLPTLAPVNALAPIKLALVVHQMHYFTYATAVVVVLSGHFSAVATVLVFTLGWVSYISAPHLIARRLEPMSAALIGHICLPFVLLGMWFVPQSGPVWTMLWIATGLFGGTVVYLTSYARQSFSVAEHELTALENLGHCLGSTVALALVAGGCSIAALLPVAAGFAGLTAILILASSRSVRQISASSRRISL